MTTGSALAKFIDERTQQHRDDLIASYWYLCNRGARKFQRAGVDRADLLQVAAIGLIKAVENFKPQLRTPFEAYAWLLIVGELMHYVRDHERIVRIPRWLRALEKPYLRADERLGARLGRTPSAREIALELDVDVKIVDELRLLRRGGAVSLESVLGSPTAEPRAIARGLSLDETLTLRIAIEKLAERERTIVLGSFAAGLSQAELGERLGLSQSQVSKLIKKALIKMQRQVA